MNRAERGSDDSSTQEQDGSNAVKRILINGTKCCTVAAAVGMLGCGAIASAAELDNNGLDVVKVRSNFYMIAGDGGNIGVEVGPDGVILVNSGAGGASDKVLAILKQLSDLPIRYIINTDSGA